MTIYRVAIACRTCNAKSFGGTRFDHRNESQSHNSVIRALVHSRVPQGRVLQGQAPGTLWRCYDPSHLRTHPQSERSGETVVTKR